MILGDVICLCEMNVTLLIVFETKEYFVPGILMLICQQKVVGFFGFSLHHITFLFTIFKVLQIHYLLNYGMEFKPSCVVHHLSSILTYPSTGEHIPSLVYIFGFS